MPTPEPEPGEARVKVHASSVNGFDVYVAKGMARGMMETPADGTLSFPITRTFTFDELPQALRLVGEERSRGKFAITIAS